jgi:hypothetical protein
MEPTLMPRFYPMDTVVSLTERQHADVAAVGAIAAQLYTNSSQGIRPRTAPIPDSVQVCRCSVRVAFLLSISVLNVVPCSGFCDRHTGKKMLQRVGRFVDWSQQSDTGNSVTFPVSVVAHVRQIGGPPCVPFVFSESPYVFGSHLLRGDTC